MGLEYAINVNIGQKEFHAKDVVPGALEMPHQLKRSVDRVNVMGMAMKRLEFVTFRPVHAFASTTRREQIVKSAGKTITIMVLNASSNVNHEAC